MRGVPEMPVQKPSPSKRNDNYIDGAKCMIRNALSLRSSAETLAHAAKYGHATSLLVLAAEEAVKAVLYYSAGNGLEIDPAGISDYKKLHKKRHGLARAMLVIAYYVDKSGSEADDAGAVEGKVVEVLKQLISDVQNDAVPERVHAVLQWWKRANDLKQKGMYVDQERDGWSVPSAVSQEIYDEAYESVKPIIDAARLIRLVERTGHITEFRCMFDIDYEALERRLAGEFWLPSDS